MGQNFSFGIEEEYFLVDAETKALVSRHAEAVSRGGQEGRQAGEARPSAAAR